jgi:hypothetical protein
LDFKHGEIYYAFYLDEGDICFVPLTDTFPAREMDQSIPEGIKSIQCYDYYVTNVKTPDQSTQQVGVYGFLDEFCAFFWTARVSLDLVAFYRRTEPPSLEDINTVFNNADRAYHYYLAFKYFILHYILFAQKHNPAVYDGIIRNKDFATGFKRIEKVYAKLCTGFYDTVLGFVMELSGKGIPLKRESSLRFIGHKENGRRMILELKNDYWKHTLLEAELAKPGYRKLADALDGF